ncbi:MAG: hypothetical protein OXI91_08030 [Chloroflexota bacterium]|nr:hypothetical protein [Chloroflexota bacterium]
MTDEEFKAILEDETKAIIGNISWVDDSDHSPAKEFRSEVNSRVGYPLFNEGRYNLLAGKLSYSLIYRGVGRIYGLDLGADHRNPDGERVGEKHKNYWKDGARDKWAYVPEDITEPWIRPVRVWNQFCAELKLTHAGIMALPAVQESLPL